MILLLVAILSITVIGKYASAPENHQKTIASLDEKKQTVMELTAAIHGDFGVDHLASGRHGNTHRGENGRCQRVSAGGSLRHLS